MFIVWLLVGEINLVHTNWLVAEFGKKWGMLANGNEGFGVNLQSVMVSWQPFVIAISILVANTLIFITLYKLQLINLNFYPFLLATWAILFAVIVSGLLYPNPENIAGEIWKIVIRLIIVVLSFPLVFFVSNWLLMHFLVRHPVGLKVADEILQQEIKSAEYIKENIHDVKRKIKKTPKKTSIDIIE